MKRDGFLCFNDWAGYREEPVRVVGETPTRYRIEADKTILLAGRDRYLMPGRTVLVPKKAVIFKDKPCSP